MDDPHTQHGPDLPPDEWLVAAPRNKRDRWAHRRGEPRVWALLWSCYLLAACILALFTPASRWSFDIEQIRYSCVTLLALIQVGVVVVWPLLRLSQLPPRFASRAAAVDLVIVLAPSAAILGPMGFLTKWSGATVVALCLSLVSWTFLYGGIVAIAGRVRAATSRALWMFLCLALAAIGPIIALLIASRATSAGADVPPTGWRAALLSSPVSSPFAIARYPSSRAPYPDALTWELVILPLFVAAALWLIAVVMDLAKTPSPAPFAHRG